MGQNLKKSQILTVTASQTDQKTIVSLLHQKRSNKTKTIFQKKNTLIKKTTTKSRGFV